MRNTGGSGRRYRAVTALDAARRRRACSFAHPIDPIPAVEGLMPVRQTLVPRSRAALLAALFAASVQACGGDSLREDAEYAAGSDDVAESPVRIDVDPCGLLNNEEISEQLFLAVSASERPSWTTSAFDVSSSEPELGVTRRCEYRFASRYSVGGGPVWHSDFDVMVFPASAVAVREDRRRPIEGAGPDMFKEPGTRAAYYVVKGRLAATLTGFPGRN
jgi:hypothetical protein